MYTAKLLPFGSFLLGVSFKEGDIDMVCASPQFIKRETHFHEDLYKIFKANKNIKELKNIIEANIPIISFIYNDQDIDISFAQFKLNILPENIEGEIPEELLEDMTEKDVDSLNGRRCNQSIINSVKDQEKFKNTLKFIKLWAKSKGVYNNMLGFLGGISWAILVAKICQMFPNYEVNQLINEFFYYYTHWDFSQIPIKIKEYYENTKHKHYNIKKRKESIFMNVMTSCFPEYNSTAHLSEFEQSKNKQIMKNIAQDQNEEENINLDDFM
ncbi:poly polymerase, putative [Ichthyophthirius multifiliis]|uniref:polynucleotide adenylyltransferase n=1 Tax=Ichthyophthirius multifiliis TaxID=5932 RepID=G0QXL6_ICHMU|nr:poly polymerase, putative [Ichthyophthirius multifiliis]EGR30046.1 poly polymerase, putative [Ichthyophthirius multifiliis]|eukprot:XP_004031282.1 poly polymerase, putative [Ichthyophthirius multifiliis]